MLREVGVSADIQVVQNGIDREQFTPNGPEKKQIGGAPAVLFVGRLVEGKRPGLALDTLNRVRDRFPDAELTLCGDGPLREELQVYSRELGIADAVRFLGHVSYDEMPSVYRAADAMILPSRSEGMPRTVLEAMSSGVPVVVSDLEQVRPVASVGGETVAKDDPSQFAATLESVLEDDSHDPVAAITDLFNWAETVEQTTEHLRQL
jgi:glycosyltransferase involved in cell wall biosynthesis